MAHELRYVLWLDPGVTTGWALYYLNQGVLYQDEYDYFTLCVRLERWLGTAGRHTMVGCERFVITPHSHRRPGSSEAMQAWGAVRSAALRHYAHGFDDRQTSSVAKSFGTDLRLRALRWYNPDMPHANDAARHVITWLAGRGLLTDLQRSKMLLDEPEEQEGSEGVG